jgi:FkbM family methyltransferase
VAVVALDYAKAPLRLGVQSPIEAQFRAHACGKEPWTVEFIEGMRRGDALWDVGANVGSYTLIAAARGHEVVAIEPGLANFNSLLENARLNNGALTGRVQALNLALGATTERIPFSQQSAPGYGEGGGITLEIQQITLDDLVFQSALALPAPTHLKIDVDGHELAVVAGAARTLTEGPCRALLIEVKRSLGERVSDLLALWGWTRVAVIETRDGLHHSWHPLRALCP